ncbi:hypothetical protein VTL71DRAFT_8302, partial [Oculimacula yallundae]
MSRGLKESRIVGRSESQTEYSLFHLTPLPLPRTGVYFTHRPPSSQTTENGHITHYTSLHLKHHRNPTLQVIQPYVKTRESSIDVASDHNIRPKPC